MNVIYLGETIKAKRRRDGVSLREVEQASGVSIATLSRLERGIGSSPDTQTLAKLAKWLDVSIGALLFAGDEKPKELEGLSTPDMIEMYLRADKNLSHEAASALANLMRVAYRTLEVS